MSTTQADLKITAGRVFCADTGLDGPGAVAVKDGRIVYAGPDTSFDARQAFSFPDGILLPGFVDLHAHPAPTSWRFGIDGDSEILPRGSTTVLSQGDTGATNWPFYRDSVIGNSRLRIRLAISPSVMGEYEDRGCFIHLDQVDVDACVAVIEQDGGEHIWGVAANLTEKACGDNDPREVMRRVLEVAERTGKPILYGVRREPSDWSLAEQLALLRPGDVFTYCFQSDAESIVQGGKIRDEVWEAREKGILFDVGHGKGNDDMGIAPDAIADGFLPDTVSSDVYKRHSGWTPMHDVPSTISRLVAVGMPLDEALTRATLAPARVLGMADQIGTLAVGADADLVCVQNSPEDVPLANVAGTAIRGRRLEPMLTIRGGEVAGVVTRLCANHASISVFASISVGPCTRPSNRGNYLQQVAQPTARSMMTIDRYNILIIMSDQHSKHHVGCHGDDLVRRE